MRKVVEILTLSAFILTSFIFGGIAQTPEFKAVYVGSVPVDFEALKSEELYVTVKFKTSGGNNLGKYLTFDAGALVRKRIENVPIDARDGIFVVARGEVDKKVFSLFEFDDKINAIPPRLIFRETRGSVGDTVTVGDLPGEIGKVNLAAVQAALDKAVDAEIYLQVKSMSEAEKSKCFAEGSLIFPQDRNLSIRTCKPISLDIYYLENLDSE